MVRIGLLGCGFVATFYMQGLAEVPDQQVVAAYGRDAAKAAAFAARWGIPESGADMAAGAARYFIGKDVKPVEVLAWGDTLVHKDKTAGEDNAIVLLRFEDGALGQSELSWTARGSLDLRNEVYGTEGSIFTDVTRATPIHAFVRATGSYLLEKAESTSGWI